MNLIQDLREYVRSSLSARRAGARKRVGGWQSSEAKRKKLARPERFELPTYSSGGCRSIQLSYGRTPIFPVYMRSFTLSIVGSEVCVRLQSPRRDSTTEHSDEPRTRKALITIPAAPAAVPAPAMAAAIPAASTSTGAALDLGSR